MSTCLRVFCDETVTALKTHSSLKNVDDTSKDEQLNFLLSLADMVEKMAPEKQVQRIKNLTKDTSCAFSHTSSGMVELVKHLLVQPFHVCLGHFPSDPIEKVFGKLRQGSGGTYIYKCSANIAKS